METTIEECFIRHSFFELALNLYFGSKFKPHGIVHRLEPQAASDFTEFHKIDEAGFGQTISSDHTSQSPGIAQIV